MRASPPNEVTPVVSQVAASISPADVLAKIWSSSGLPFDALQRVNFTGTLPVLPSIFAVDALASASIAAAGIAAVELHRRRTGVAQTVTVDAGHAAAEFRSERHLKTPAPPAPVWDPIAGLYGAGDGRFVRIHTNFPHHRDGFLRLLKCANDRAAVENALQSWTAESFETAAATAQLVATMTRSPDEWAAYPQGRAVAQLPLIEITRVGNAPPRPFPPAHAPA